MAKKFGQRKKKPAPKKQAAEESGFSSGDDNPAFDNDEEISEDDAFNEDDYALYGNIGSHKKGAEEEKDDEGDEDEEEKDDDDLYENLSDLLGDEGGGGAPEAVEDVVDDDDEDVDEDDEGAHNDMLTRMNSMLQKGKGKKKQPVEITEVVEEGDFSLGHGAGAQVTLQDLIKGTEQPKHAERRLAALSKQSRSLAAPLEKHEQERLDRKVAAKLTGEDIKKWEPIVKKNREVEHLSFSGDVPKANLTNSALAAKFKASTDFELEMEVAVKDNTSADLDTAMKDLAGLESNELNEDQIIAHRAELAKLRSFLSYQDQKFKRKKKIKSKSYHRVLKKQRERQNLKGEEVIALDPDSAAAAEETERMEARRALERMTQKHGRNSKFLKMQKKMGHMAVPQTKQAIAEQLRLKEELKKKIQSAVGSDSEGSEGADIDDDGNLVFEGSDNKSAARAHDEPIEFPKKGLLAMKFMQRGILKEQSRMRDDYDAMETEAADSKGGNRGRLSFQPNDGATKSKKMQKKAKGKEDTVEDSAAGKDAKSGEPAQTTDEFAEAASWNVDVEANVSHRSKKKRTEGKKKEEPILSLEMTQPVVKPKNNIFDISTTSDMDLVNQAFATNEIVQEFQEEKESIVNESKSAERSVSTELPGWGAWSGCGVKSSGRAKRPLPAKKIVPKKARTDDTLSHVIITEKRDRKLAKYKADSIPFPFKTKEQFERSLETPLGKEWNTHNMHGKFIKPAVAVKPGTLIEPIKMSEKKRKEKEGEYQKSISGTGLKKVKTSV